MTIRVESTCDIARFIRYGTIEGNYIVDWGDDCIEVNKLYHFYKEAGVYQVTVKGDFKVGHTQFPYNIISLDKEEGCEITDLSHCFIFCQQLKSVPRDWDLSKVANMASMFYGTKSFNQDLSHWNLEEMYTRYMFDKCPIEEKHKPKGVNFDV